MKNSIKTLLTAGALALSITCPAIDLVRPVMLPDDGFGSGANGFMDYTDDACMIVGRKTTLGGVVVPMAWDLNNDGSLLSAVQLPLPSGFQGGCQKVGMLGNGRLVALGTLTDAEGKKRAVLWRRNLTGTWNQPQFLSTSHPQSFWGDDNGDIPFDHLNGVLVAAYSRLNSSGVWRPALAAIGNSSVSTITLPANGTRNYFAHDVAISDTGAHVVGSGYNASGLLKATEWEIDIEGMVAGPTNIPIGNGAGAAYGVLSDSSGGWAVAGQRMRNGQLEGFYTNSPGGGLLGLKPLAGHTEATAYNLGDTATHEVGHIIFGHSQGGTTGPLATIWSKGATFPAYSISESGPILDWIAAYVPQNGPDAGLAAVGTARTVGGNLQATAFLPSGAMAPDLAQIVSGSRVGSVHVWGQTFPLWHNDAAELSLKTALVGTQREAAIETTSASLRRGIARYEWDFNIIARAYRTNGNPASGTLQASAYCHEHQEFELVGTVGVTGASEAFTLPFAEQSLHSYDDPQSGLMRARLRFVQNGSGTVFIAVSKFTSDDDPDHYQY